MNKLVEVRGFPPIPQKTRNGWGTELFWLVHFRPLHADAGRAALNKSCFGQHSIDGSSRKRWSIRLS